MHGHCVSLLGFGEGSNFFFLQWRLLAAGLPRAAVALRGPVGCCRSQRAFEVALVNSISGDLLRAYFDHHPALCRVRAVFRRWRLFALVK